MRTKKSHHGFIPNLFSSTTYCLILLYYTTTESKRLENLCGKLCETDVVSDNQEIRQVVALLIIIKEGRNQNTHFIQGF